MTIIELIFASLIIGIILGLFWKGKTVTLILIAACVGLTVGAIFAKWPDAQSTFSSFWAFIWVLFTFIGFFSFLVAPAVIGAIAMNWLKIQLFKKNHKM